MELIFSILKYSVFGFFGLIGLLIVVVMVFGKRIDKKWDYEADFRDESGKEFGELDVEMSRIEKDEQDYSLKAKFRMRHPSLKRLATVQVFLDDLLILEGMVEKDGRIRLGKQNLQNEITDPPDGQLCRVVCGGEELFSQVMEPD